MTSSTRIRPTLQLYGNQFIDLQCKSMNWFPQECNIGLFSVNDNFEYDSSSEELIPAGVLSSLANILWSHFAVVMIFSCKLLLQMSSIIYVLQSPKKASGSFLVKRELLIFYSNKLSTEKISFQHCMKQICHKKQMLLQCVLD